MNEKLIEAVLRQVEDRLGERPTALLLGREPTENHGYRFAVAEAEAPQTVYDADLSYPLILAVGGEKRGFSKNISDMADLTVSLPYGRDFPMALSAASAATVLAFEAARQNRNNL